MMFPRDEDEQREWIYKEQVKTNELLKQLIELLTPKTTALKPMNKKANGKKVKG